MSKTIPLADIAKKAKVDMKTARRRLRAAVKRREPKARPAEKGHWVFKPAQVATIRDLIRG